MRLAFFLDNTGWVGRGALPPPSLGNPGIGGTEYAFLAVADLLQGSELEPLLMLAHPQAIAGVPTMAVADLAAAVRLAEQARAVALVFRPGAVPVDQWPALRASGVPLLAWFHNLGCLQQDQTEALPSLYGWVLVSGAQLDYCRHSRLAAKAVVIPNPVAVPPAMRKPRPWADAQAATDLAYMGALTPFKGFDRLAARWGAIAAACPQARLRVFGGADLYGPQRSPSALSPYERHCRHVLQCSGAADRVVFEGSRGLERYDAFQRVAVGVVNPSGADETFCLSAAEFNACGIPVVSARRHALPQTVLDGRTGLLSRSDRQLAQHCMALLEQPEVAWSMGRAGQLHVAEAFGVDTVRQRWLALARQIAEGRAVSPVGCTTSWYHEQRWLRQLWGWWLWCPAWPSWPVAKGWLKRLAQGGDRSLTSRGVGLLATGLALLIWALVVFGKYGGNPTGLARIGDQLSRSPRLQGIPLVELSGRRGNDGQQFLTLALDPLQADSGTSAALDNPVYRGKRLLYPLLAWLLGFGQPGWVVWTQGWLNVACVGVAAACVAQWAQLHQRSSQWGFAVLALPGFWVTLSLNTADLLATTCLLAAAVAWVQRRRGATAFSLAAALLSRETAILAWVSTLTAALKARAWTWLVPLLLAPLPLGLWVISLGRRFPQVGDGALARLHFGWPFQGILAKLAQLAGQAPGSAEAVTPLEWCFDSLSFGFWCSSLLVLAVVCCSRSQGPWMRITAGVYVVPALCTGLQILARFPDYTRVWIDLASLVLLAGIAAPALWLRWFLGLSALVSCGYGVGYALLAP